MAKGRLFEYAILWHPKEKKDAAGNPMESKKSQILKAPTMEIATKEEDVAVLAARAIPEEYMDRLDEIEIVVRPFAPLS